MTDTHAEKQVPILAALAQATRLQILDRVAEAGPQGLVAGEIARSIRCPASTLSFHLKELSRTGVLEARPDGRFIHYSLRAARPPGARRLHRGSRGAVPASPWTQDRRSAIRAPPQAADTSQLTFFGD